MGMNLRYLPTLGMAGATFRDSIARDSLHPSDSFFAISYIGNGGT